MTENEAKLARLKVLFTQLPPSIPEGERKGAIHQVLNNIHTANGWESFNTKFDTLFGVSTINADGTLKNLTRGPKGAGLVMRALEHFLSQEGMPDIAWLKVDRLIDACEAAIELAQGESAGSHSTALPAATETAVEAAARVSKGPNKAKPKEPVIKRPSIVTELGSVNYLAIHDAQELDIPLSPGKKKAAKNYKPPKNHSESDSEEDAEVRLAPDGHEIIDSEPDNSVLPSKRKRIVDSASGSGSTSVSGESDFEDVTTDLAESSDDESVVEIGTKQGNLGTQKEQPLKKRKKKTARRKSKAKRPRKSSEPKQTAKSKTKNPGVPELINVDSIPETDSDTPPAIPGKRGPRNKSLRHYYNPVPVKDKSNELRWSFTCRYCKTVRTVARTKGIDDFELERNVAGLANLASHIAQKHSSHLAMAAPTEGQDEVATTEAGVTKASQAILKSFVERGKLNPRLDPTQNGFNRMVSVWILEDGLPFTASESPGLARIFKYVRVPYKLPSDTTVRAALKDVFNELSNAVTSEVKKVPSKISFSSDAWTTKQMTFSFSGLFGHWITNDWDLRMRLLSFTPLQPDDHKGFYAAISFANTAAKRGALKKILAHTMDGASSNDTQAQTTSVILQKKYSIHWAPSNGRIFCMAHGGHRTVQKFLQILEEADDPEIDDYFLHHRSQPIHYSAEDDPGVIEHEAETALASLDEEPETVEEWQEESLIFSSETLSPVKKIHLTCIKIVSTPGRRSVFRSIATKYCPKFKHLMPIRSVATRWNSVLASMERAILLRPAITQWVRRHPELEYLELSNTDWSFIEQIVTVLSLFSGMTLQMSRADTPTLPWALPLYQHISKSLLSLAKPDEAPEYPIPKPGQPPRKALSPKIRNAILGALVVWEKYRGYALTSHFPILATLCHPTFRIRWFEGAAPELEAKARVLFDTLFDSYDSNTPSKEQPTEPATSLSRSASRSSLASSFLEDVLGPLEGDGRSTELPAESEIIRYFRGDGGVSDDPLLWWKAHSHEFPIISQMAKDFLAIPGSSVSVERLFSSARHLCADARSSLQAKTITEAMCSKQWMKEGVEGFTLVRNKED